MKKSENKNIVYFGTLYRFGYDLTCANTSKKKVIDAIMAEYATVYEKENNLDPRKVYSYDPKRSDYTVARNDVEIREYEMGKVEWF